VRPHVVLRRRKSLALQYAIDFTRTDTDTICCYSIKLQELVCLSGPLAFGGFRRSAIMRSFNGI